MLSSGSGVSGYSLLSSCGVRCSSLSRGCARAVLSLCTLLAQVGVVVPRYKLAVFDGGITRRFMHRLRTFRTQVCAQQLLLFQSVNRKLYLLYTGPITTRTNKENI